MTMASCGGTGATEYAANRNRTWSGDGVMTAARSRVGPPAPAVPPRQDVGGHCRLAFASGAGRAMGMVVGPEAPPPNRTPLMEVASGARTAANHRSIPDKAGTFPVLIQHLKRLRIGPNTDADASRDAHP